MKPELHECVITNSVRVCNNSRHVVPLISPRALIEATAMNPDSYRELGVLLDGRVSDDVQG
jgi:hypothetical protein